MKGQILAVDFENKKLLKLYLTLLTFEKTNNLLFLYHPQRNLHRIALLE